MTKKETSNRTTVEGLVSLIHRLGASAEIHQAYDNLDIICKAAGVTKKEPVSTRRDLIEAVRLFSERTGNNLLEEASVKTLAALWSESMDEEKAEDLADNPEENQQEPSWVQPPAKMRGTWEKEGDEYLYMIDGNYAAISILPPELDDFDRSFQLSIGYPSNIKQQYFLDGSWREIKMQAGKIADTYLDENDVPTLKN